MNISIREEQPGDIDAIRFVNDKAFGQGAEGRIVEALRNNGGYFRLGQIPPRIFQCRII